MTETTELVTLSADQAKALRNADDVSFHYDADADVKACIVARRDVDPGDGFGKRELRVDIPVDKARFTIYEPWGGTGRSEPVKAFWSLCSAKYNEHWPTVARFLKAGDALQLHWTGGDTSETLSDAGFKTNSFTLIVVRVTGKEQRVALSKFLLGFETVRKDNDFTLKF